MGVPPIYKSDPNSFEYTMDNIGHNWDPVLQLSSSSHAESNLDQQRATPGPPSKHDELISDSPSPPPRPSTPCINHPDAGHQSCVYCDEDFDDSKNYVYRRDHHAKHVRDEDQDALDDRYKHRCTYPASCGMKDKYWRDSQYVLQNRIPVNEYRRQLGLGDTFTQSDGDDDYDESIHDNASQPHHGSGGIGRGERTRSTGSGSNRR